LAKAAEAGIERDRITAELEHEGIESFCGSYASLLRRIETQLVPSRAAAA